MTKQCEKKGCRKSAGYGIALDDKFNIFYTTVDENFERHWCKGHAQEVATERSIEIHDTEGPDGP